MEEPGWCHLICFHSCEIISFTLCNLSLHNDSLIFISNKGLQQWLYCPVKGYPNMENIHLFRKINEYFPSPLCPDNILLWLTCFLNSPAIIYLLFCSYAVQMCRSRSSGELMETKWTKPNFHILAQTQNNLFLRCIRIWWNSIHLSNFKFG